MGVELQNAALDEVQRQCARVCGAQFLVGRIGLADPQVLGNGAIEQQRLLKHHADVPAQRRQRHAANVHTINLDEAGLRIERAVKERNGGGLACTGFADQCKRLPGSAVNDTSSNRASLAVIENETSLNSQGR